MQPPTWRNFARHGLFLGASGAILTLAMLLGPIARADDQTSDNPKMAALIALGHKFLGSTSCKSCHGDPAGDPSAPPVKGSEYTVWSTLDKHHLSYATLQSDQSKAIATKGGYGDPTTSSKCLACHALDVPAALQGPDFKIAEGNTCDSCHGPAELWSGTDVPGGWSRVRGFPLRTA